MNPKIHLCFVVGLLCISWPLVSSSHHHRAHRNHNLADYMLKKFESIVQWLDNSNETTAFDYIYQINHGAGLNLFQGDIKGYNPRLRTAIRDPRQLWNTRQVPYIIDSSYDAKAHKDIADAIEEYHQKTCIRFVPRSNQKDYVVFKPISGCYSTIGRVGGEQEISLVGPCLRKGTAVHEMMHALGFWHEHSRPDRDAWVQIIYDNIKPGKKYNFDKLSVDEVDTLGVNYDYGSVMHYSKHSFSKNGSPTLLPTRDPNAQIGQRIGLSPKDALRVNKLYHCGDHQSANPTSTQPFIVPTKPQTTIHQVHPTKMPQTKAPVFQTMVPEKLPTRSTTITTTRAQAQTTEPQPGWTGWSSFSPCDLRCHHYRTRFCLNMDPSFCRGKREEVETCGAPCKPAVSLGCWKMDPHNLSIPSAEGTHGSLMDHYKMRVAALRKCADVASVKGYLVFALIDDGMCLTGPQAQNMYNKNGVSLGCGYRGKGGKNEASVYSFQSDIDGGWGLWSVWTQCYKTCGGGLQYRYRQCDSPTPVGHGKPCQGLGIQEQSCNEQPCLGGAKCGTMFHTGVAGTSGVIHVLNYDNAMYCEYHIVTGDPDLTISVAVTRLDVEYSKACTYDSLMIFDGNSDAARLVGAYCGNKLPETFVSTTNNVYLRFESDNTNKASGYTVYWSINSKARKACVQPQKPAHATIIGKGNLVNDERAIRCDPGFRLVGASTVKCIDQPTFALWSDKFPVCMPARKRSLPVMRQWICTFEESLCGMKNEKDNDFNWFVTESQERGRLLYVESNRLQDIGDKGRIVTNVNHPSQDNYCLSFNYQIWGDETTQMTVYSRHEGDRETLLNNITGSLNEEWQKINITIKSTQFFQVVFEGEISEKSVNSISIDDISLMEGQC